MNSTLPITDGLKLGFGLMRLPRLGNNTQYDPIDVEQTKKMVDAFLEAGGKYFDTAFVYEGSEEATRDALCLRHPRESYYLASKLNAASFACKSEAEAKAQLATSLERTQAGYFDFYLLHAIGPGNAQNYEDYGIWQFAAEAKEKGLIRHMGFSFHGSPELLDEVLTKHPEAEFVQLQINYGDWLDKSVQSKAVYDVACKHGKPIIVMEPVKGGTLANPPQVVKDVLEAADPSASPASWAIRYVASLPGVMTVLSGMSNEAQMEDNLSYMKDFQPLSEEEQQVIEKAREALYSVDHIPCTDCHYCTKGCPVNMHIPEIFSVMNLYKMYGALDAAKRDYGWRPGGSKASDCVQCGQCESACPQHLPIMELLQETAQVLEA